MKCPICDQEQGVIKGRVIKGQYYKACDECLIDEGIKINRDMVGDGKYNIERGREDYAKEILQPFEKGKPNPEFINAYPNKARNFFNQKDLENNN